MIDTLVLATHNEGKIAEFARLLDGLVGEVRSAASFGLDAPDETGATFTENATIKARFVAEATGLPSLADDSGLCVAALGGDPGVYTADWAGEPRDFGKAMTLVNEKLGDADDRRACFASVLALAMPDGTVEVFEGRVDGTVCWPPRGSAGFGYDPMFVPEGRDLTFGEMSREDKNRISHRARAAEKLKAWFTQSR